jgi:hypothetical protein
MYRYLFILEKMCWSWWGFDELWCLYLIISINIHSMYRVFISNWGKLIVYYSVFWGVFLCMGHFIRFRWNTNMEVTSRNIEEEKIDKEYQREKLRKYTVKIIKFWVRIIFSLWCLFLFVVWANFLRMMRKIQTYYEQSTF